MTRGEYGESVIGVRRGNANLRAKLGRVPITASAPRGGDHRPQLADLRESGSIEQDADLAMFIFREEVYKPDDAELGGRADIIVAKQRNGSTGKVRLTFLKSYSRFEPLAEQDAGLGQ